MTTHAHLRLVEEIKQIALAPQKEPPVFPPVDCGIGELYPENAKEVIEAVWFSKSKTLIQECWHEVNFLKRANPEWIYHNHGMADVEITAIIRVWNRYLNNGGWRGYLPPLPPKPPPSSNKRTLEPV